MTVLTVVAALLAHDEAERDDHAADRARAAADVGRLEAELDAAVSRTGQVAALAADGTDAFRSGAANVASPLVRAFVLADRDGSRIRAVAGDSVAPLSVGSDLRAITGLAATMDAARTAAETRATGIVQLERGAAIVVVAPVYPAGTDVALAARRAATAGLVAAIIRYDDLRSPDRLQPLWPGAPVQVRGPTGAVGTAVPDPVLRSSVRVTGEVWPVIVGGTPGGVSRIAVLIFAIGLSVVILTYLVLRRQHFRRREAEVEAELRSDQLEIIAGTSAALQQSLDLAELLPTFCVTVADQFELRGVSVHVTDDESRLVEAFRYGEVEGGRHARQFELRRGWRTVGRLITRADHPLDDLACQSLQALCDLLAVAVSNAQLYQREQQAVSRLRELDALKNAFLGTVSHELRTSTTAVQGFGELLTDHWDALPDERRRELAARIRRQAGSLRHLVDDLLDYARLEHESLRVTPRMVSLSELVSQLSDSMSPLVSDHEVVLRIEKDVQAWADPIAVERILANLLSNAGKYAPGGSRVTVTVRRVGDRARLSVADQGPGIPAEERRRVFVRFYRLSNPETVKTRGAGIGLAILRDFASRSGAEVSIDDAPGGGALVHVDFLTADPQPDRTLVPAGEEVRR